MEKKYINLPGTLLLLGLSAFLFLPHLCRAEDSDTENIYVENEWDFVDQSMDISEGIPEDAAGRLLAIKNSGKLTVATEPYFAPQEFIDPDLSGQESYVGADMELARLIAEKMDVELEIVPLSFTRVLSSVADGEYDLAISALAYTPGRTSSLELSKGYYYTQNEETDGLLIRTEDTSLIQDLDSLKERNLVAQSGSLQESLASDNIFSYRQFRRVSSIQEVYRLLENGEADAAVVNIENAQGYIRNNPDCGLTLVPGIRFSMEEAFRGDRIAAKKGEIQLICFVNGVIDEVLESGQYEEWLEIYTGRADELGL